MVIHVVAHFLACSVLFTFEIAWRRTQKLSRTLFCDLFRPCSDWLRTHDAELQGATPFDAPKIEAIKLNHRGDRCTFEAIIEDYATSDSAVQRLGLIVRAADVKGQEDATPEDIGLHSIAHGFAATGLTDEERLARQFPVYDALYAYVQSKH
jgi:hypothetical protein